MVATINHRLNVFGHCYLGGVLGDDFQQSGNVGYLDLIASMKWVRENISQFGGDPEQRHHLRPVRRRPEGQPLLCRPRRAGPVRTSGIVQSGSHLKVQTPERANGLTEALLKELGIAKADARKLQTIDVETLSTAQRKVIAAGRRALLAHAGRHVAQGAPFPAERARRSPTICR